MIRILAFFIVPYTFINCSGNVTIKSDDSIISSSEEKNKIIQLHSDTRNPINKELLTVHFTKKVVNSNETDDDTLILNLDQNDIIENIYDKNELILPKNVITFSQTIVGKEFFNEVVLPFVNSLYTTVFDIIQEVYVQRLIKFITKKQIEIYKKK